MPQANFDNYHSKSKKILAKCVFNYSIAAFPEQPPCGQNGFSGPLLCIGKIKQEAVAV